MIGFTKERLKQFINSPLEHGLTRSEQMEMARQLLASMEQEPYGYVHKEVYESEGSCGLSSDHEAYRDSGTHIPLYAAPQLPQPAVPECYQRLLHHAYGMTMGHDWNKGTMAGHHREKMCKAVEACRAAMLQGAEPVSQPYTLREGVAAIRSLGGIDAGKIQAERDALSEPAQEWVPCSERMPVDNDIVLVVDDGYFVCEAQYRDGDFFSAVRGKGEFFETACRDVELWMPLPAAPQQEAATDNTTQQLESLGLVVTSDERKMEIPRCSKHPEIDLQVHPFEQLMSYPPQPVMYCPLCRPSVAEWVEFDKQLRQRKEVK